MHYNPNQYWQKIFKSGVHAKSVCYPDWPLTYNNFLHLQQLTTFKYIIEKHKIKIASSKIVEIGPGAGFWTSFFNHHSPRQYIGLDINHSVVEHLTKAFPEFNFFCTDITEADLPTIIPTQVDLIFCAMVFLHITDNSKLSNAFSQLCNQLSSGKYFIFLDSIYTKNVFGETKKQTDGESFDPQFHNKVRSLDYYKNLAKSNNMTLVEVLPAFNTSQFCFDFKSYLGYLLWGKLFYAVQRRILNNASESTGFYYSKFQNVLDNFLTKKLKLSMSSKWVILKKN